MTAKETIVLLIGLFLIGFLYKLKFPHNNLVADQVDSNNQSQTSAVNTQQVPGFNPKTEKPVLDSILDVPAWTLDITKLGELTVEEIVKSINTSVEEKRFFNPENDNTLFYLVNLKSLDETNPSVEEFTQILFSELENRTLNAIAKHDVENLKSIISQYKTLGDSNNVVQNLSKKLSTISTINKLYEKGIKQISNEIIISNNTNDAWHTAYQSLKIDPENSKTQDLVSKVISILLNDALRAAEEIDFQLALNYVEEAELLAPGELTIEFTKDKILELKQQRYVWLESQLSMALRKLNIDRSNRMIAQIKDLGIDESELQSYQNEIKRIEVFGAYKELEEFNDFSLENKQLPTMVVMPLGQYIMGNNSGPKHEKPEHLITIDYGFAVSQNEISVADFELFIQSTDYKTDAKKSRSSRIYDLRTGRIKNKNRITWERDYIGNIANKKLPVIHVSWNDALAYTEWLSQQTGKNYRLLSESEFEYILRAGAGTRTRYPWGDGNPVQVTENLTGKLDRTKLNSRIRWKKGFEKYNDQHWGPATVGSFMRNQFKLNDTAGNVMEWVMDCWHDSYVRAPTDGSAWVNKGCDYRVIRGGGWSSPKNEYESSHRFIAKSNYTDARLGFRIAVDLKQN